MAVVSVTLQHVCPSKSSLFAKSCSAKPKFLEEIPSHPKSLCNSLWTEASRTKAITMLNSLQGWLTESNLQWLWRVGTLPVKLSWTIFNPTNSHSVPTSVIDLTFLSLWCKSLWNGPRSLGSAHPKAADAIRQHLRPKAEISQTGCNLPIWSS